MILNKLWHRDLSAVKHVSRWFQPLAIEELKEAELDKKLEIIKMLLSTLEGHIKIVTRVVNPNPLLHEKNLLRLKEAVGAQAYIASGSQEKWSDKYVQHVSECAETSYKVFLDDNKHAWVGLLIGICYGDHSEEC